MARVRYWVWLSCLRGVRASTKRALIEAFGDPERLYEASRETLACIRGLRPQELENLSNRDMTEAEQAIEACLARGITVLTMQDAGYPERLWNIPDPPVVLYVWGKLPPVDDHPVFAVIGTRKASAYGLRMASKLGRELTEAGALVVSGLADGCDSVAMDAALRAGGDTVGVLGTAIDEVYPAKNRALFERVKAHGALVSEHPPGTRTYPSDFKARNRIISGLSLGVVVAEAPIRSGTRVTVDHALEQGRDVFAIPGNADAAASAGCNDLIAHGATVAVCAEDVLREYAARYDLTPYRARNGEAQSPPAFPAASAAPKQPRTPIKKEIDKPKDIVYIDLTEAEKSLPSTQQKILLALKRPAMHADELIEATGIPAAEALAALTILQVTGYVAGEGRRYTRLCKM